MIDTENTDKAILVSELHRLLLLRLHTLTYLMLKDALQYFSAYIATIAAAFVKLCAAWELAQSTLTETTLLEDATE